MTNKAGNDKALLEQWSVSSKQFYSAGSSFSTIACGATVLIVWRALEHINTSFNTEYCGVGLSILIVWAYALVIPEPPGYPDEGKRRITLSEFLFGFLNSFIVFSTALMLKAYC